MLKIVIFLVFCSFAGSVFSQTPMQLLASIESPFVSDTNSWGVNIKGSGDINGDGYNDIVLAGQPLGSGNGRRDVYIYLGGSTVNTDPDYIIPDPSYPGPYHAFGSAISYNGDLNGDGYCDLVISEPQYGYENWGRVLVYYGGPGFDTIPDLVFDGMDYGVISFGLQFGDRIDVSGDFNGDGFNDLVVSSLHANLSHYGQVNVFFGGSDINTSCDWHYNGILSEEFGAEFAVGDINGDGFSDLATISLFTGSSDTQNQIVKIFLGGYNFDNQVDASYVFDHDNTWIIMFMDGDSNQDGFDDLVVKNSLNNVLYGSSDLPGGFESLNLPLEDSFPVYYVVSNDSTFVVNTKADVNPNLMEYNLSSYYSGGSYINNYRFAYTPNPISNCMFGYSLGDVNNDGSIEILVTNRENNSVVFNIVTTHYNPNSTDDVVQLQSINLSVSPNPFSNTSMLSYELREPGRILLSIYNLRGQLVTSISEGYRGAGHYNEIWNGKDSLGRKLPSGVYLIKLSVSDKYILFKKVTLCY
ncbi:MAG: FG-GAP-like repeat-containing protein [Candidatus Cloacimonadaceae bacterium]|nr:FG-GAP-like repeat-containing protein [Candidatus Cloacimonadaceae bacterium]MDP3115291.1 FG-GAP-like repeat-containing protein [Candidatus Cloacimonadaceae bacterium]